VRLFAAVRERVGRESVELELPDGARVRDALDRIEHLAPDLPLVLAVNRRYASDEEPLSEGDELAVVPPVSGGAFPAPEEVHAVVTEEPLSLDAVVRAVADPRAGATVTFTGTTRDVEHVDYEAYAEMARERIAEIVAEAIHRHELCSAAAEHRVGRVPRGEPSVIVAASAPHRREAFMGARELIDRIKAEVPIWKREQGVWVPGTVPTTALAPSENVDVVLDDWLDQDAAVTVDIDGRLAAARVVWLGGRFHQLRFETPLHARRGDRVIVRDLETGAVRAQGEVLDPRAERHDEPGEDLLVRLTRLERGEDVRMVDGRPEVLPPPLDPEARALERRYRVAGANPPADAELTPEERVALFALREAGIVVRLERGRHIHISHAPPRPEDEERAASA